MNRADEVIPFVALREVANPIFVSRNEIDFERELDCELRELALGALHFLDVFVELAIGHAPIVEVIPRHRAVIAEADLLEADLERLCGIVYWLANCVMAQRRVHVIIGQKRHRAERSRKPRMSRASVVSVHA